jgi:putative nucleotidyltransferase with HDIG domain
MVTVMVVTGAEEEPLPNDDEGYAFGLIESLVTAVDNKDSYTRRHSDEVTKYALTLAEALGLSEATQQVLRVAGLLHDVGKIGIPDRILRKPGRLTPAEYEIVKRHPMMGETIIAAVPDLGEIRAAVVSHDERYGGGGYPYGLAGDQIPLLGRILAVVDAYSAMTTDRPYHKALSRDEAIVELRAGSGGQFDPDMVEVLIACIETSEDLATGAAAAPSEQSTRLHVGEDSQDPSSVLTTV